MGGCAGSKQETTQQRVNQGQQNTQDNGRTNAQQPSKSPREDADIPDNLKLMSTKPMKKNRVA